MADKDFIYCTSCDHFSGDIWCLRNTRKERDPATGLMREAGLLLAGSERRMPGSDTKACGPKARFFKPRRSFWRMLWEVLFR